MNKEIKDINKQLKKQTKAKLKEEKKSPSRDSDEAHPAVLVAGAVTIVALSGLYVAAKKITSPIRKFLPKHQYNDKSKEVAKSNIIKTQPKSKSTGFGRG